MTPLSDRLGRLFYIPLDGLEVDAVARDLLRHVRPGGVTLFRRNLESAGQIARLCRDIRRSISPPPVIAIDQEGGRVSRLTPPFPPLPTPWEVARTGGPDLCRRFGEITGRGVRSLGMQVDFAPVVDLSHAGDEDGIGDRAFDADPERAAVCAAAFLDGLESAGVAGCLKHFPGLGGAPGDTHECLPRLDWSAADRERALAPFRRLAGRADLVMVSHAHYPLLSGPDPQPASLDPRVVRDLLRREIGFSGLILSDDLEMGAVNPDRDFADLAPRALAAGSDQALICQRGDRTVAAYEAVRQAARGGHLDPTALEASLARVDAFLAGPAGSAPEEPFDAARFQLVLDDMDALAGTVARRN